MLFMRVCLYYIMSSQQKNIKSAYKLAENQGCIYMFMDLVYKLAMLN